MKTDDYVFLTASPIFLLTQQSRDPLYPNEEELVTEAGVVTPALMVKNEKQRDTFFDVLIMSSIRKDPHWQNLKQVLEAWNHAEEL